MIIVTVCHKDRYAEKHLFEDIADALTFVALAFDEVNLQFISLDYERTTEK